MPKPTFLNLPDDKRERFVAVARDEFARHPYDQASISRLVKELGIAKGSVYQYFDGKLDLFGWLLDEARRRKLAWFEGLESGSDDPFEQLRFAYREGLEFWRAEPSWNRIALRLLEPSADPGVQALRDAHQAQVYAFLEGWIASAQQRGRVRGELDPETTARFVHGLLSDGMLAAFLVRLGTDLDGLADTGGQLDAGAEDASRQVADQAMDLLQRAIGI